MAASKGRHGVYSLGKPLYQILAPRKHLQASFPSFRRAAHNTSTYDKNIDDDQVQSSTVPDDAIQPQSEKYWAPHPKTGVFGPVTEQNSRSEISEAGDDSGRDSVLEEKAWFRPTSLEDLEKPHQP